MRDLKSALGGACGWFGFVLFYILVIVLVIMPLTALDFPWWAAVLFIIATQIFPVLGGIAWLVVWTWSFFVMIHAPLCSYTVVYFISFAVYLIFFFIPMLLRMFSPPKE